ncbi:MAG: M20/M25/M40 family metallo-hydrolase [Gemmatimonadetes bacterium]|nr:M20/M25/M40 family metallo-hydrolase [Gemmatimonadota bacterium]
MKKLATTLLAAALCASPLSAQTFPTNDRVLRNMWTQGMGPASQATRLAQILFDSIGPRLTGTAGHASAVDWVARQYAAWGIGGRKEQYGTWKGWRRGYTKLELTAPRGRGLEGTMLGYSPGTDGPVEGEVVVFPELPDSAAYQRWLGEARGKFIVLMPAEPTCRPAENLEAHARPRTVEGIFTVADSVHRAWSGRYARAGRNLMARIDASGAAALLTSLWSEGWGVDKIQDTENTRIPEIDLSCEDNGLLVRLAENRQGPRVLLDAEAELTGEPPAFNVIAELSGRQLPNEYILLSAHLDSFDSSSGATDNGTGTVMMMEAMRILKAAYPNPRRTIVVGHWGGEEQGENGSGSFAADHPEVVSGIQVGFNQDNGSWRVEAIRMQGFNRAEAQVDRWLRKLPREIADTVAFTSPDREGGSDHESFTCHGAPVLRLQSNYSDYRQYTWHTNRDSYDKVILDDLKNNATMVAMLAYLASEDPERLDRTRDPLAADAQGRVQARPSCGTPRRSSTGR